MTDMKEWAELVIKMLSLLILFFAVLNGINTETLMPMLLGVTAVGVSGLP